MGVRQLDLRCVNQKVHRKGSNWRTHHLHKTAMKHLTLTLTLCAAALLVACGKQETSAPAAPAAPAPAPAPVAAENTLGKSVFGKTCAMCHAAGVAGAPKPGDKEDWAPRIAQGKDTLYKHAIEGFTGSKGQMPARGANAALPDAEVKAAVDYMVDASH
jgi:cytochrome c5